jgi:MFS family permease
MTRPSFRRELVTSCTMPMAIAMMESGVTGIIAAKLFDIQGLLLAVFAAAPMFANITSMFWARLARGRRKVPVINAFQVGVLLCVAAVAALPVSEAGGYMLTAAYVLARCLIAGVVTVRSAVWRANYPRAFRGRITARLAVVMQLSLLLGSLAAAMLMDANPESFRIFYPLAAVCGAVGVVAYSRIRMRREREQLRYERTPNVRPTPHGEGAPIYEYDPKESSGFFQVLRHDPAFRSYMICQMFLGGANMMIEAPVILLVALASERIAPLSIPAVGISDLSVGFIVAIGLTQIIPVALAMVTVGWWGHRLDHMHVTRFRAQQAWIFVLTHVLTYAAAALVLAGSIAGGLAALAVARIGMGLARGGGMIAWNLGHNDFASRRMVAVYMGIHMTLTGVRGAVFPFIGMALYTGWQPVDLAGLHLPGWAGIGAPTFLLAAALAIAGAIGYGRMARRLGHVHAPTEID